MCLLLALSEDLFPLSYSFYFRLHVLRMCLPHPTHGYCSFSTTATYFFPQNRPPNISWLHTFYWILHYKRTMLLIKIHASHWYKIYKSNCVYEMTAHRWTEPVLSCVCSMRVCVARACTARGYLETGCKQ